MDTTPPTGRASDMLDAERLRAQAAQQEQERQRVIAEANAGGGPKLR